MLIMNKVVVRGCTQDQPLAQNWSRANPLQWVSKTLRTTPQTPAELQESELQVLFEKPRSGRQNALNTNRH
jgi:hypothetical protein